MSEYLQAISTVGFPICCCVAMFILMDKETKAHREEVSSLKEVITDIKLTMQELVDTIKSMKE